MISRRSVLIGIGTATTAVAIGATSVWPSFQASITFHRNRVSRGSELLNSELGTIEYAIAGAGIPVLAIHGSGGGFDQMIEHSHLLHNNGFQIIAPSRFGYLRSANPLNATPEMQADAFLELLDHLKLERVAVLGISAGAVSAVQFAARHPARCLALALLVPAVTAAGPELGARGPSPKVGPVAKALVEYTVKSDLLFWLGCRFTQEQMYGSVLATNSALVAAASKSDQARAKALMWNILPISLRAAGLTNDVRFTSTSMQIDLKSITVPTLTISLEDDLYGTAEAARYIAAHVPGARAVIYPTGGHIFIGHEADAFLEISSFFSTHNRLSG